MSRNKLAYHLVGNGAAQPHRLSGAWGATEQRDAADEGRLAASGSIIVGTVIVSQGEVVRPSQLIASVSRTWVGWSMQRQPDVWALLLTATFCLALLPGLAAGGDAVPSQIDFFVYYHNATRAVVGRQGVDVTLVGTGGTVVLGATDSNGQIKLKTNELFSPGNVALLFCDHKLPEVCTALRLESEFLKGFAEFNVHLPLVETIDRLKVTPSPRRE